MESSLLAGATSADVCVIGAGIAGLTTAYMLLRAGKSVVVIDADSPGAGETARTTAHLVTALDRGWRSIVDVHGRDRAHLAAESHREAIRLIERIVREEELECDLAAVDGYLLAGEHGDPAKLDGELEAAHAVGLTDVHKVTLAPGVGIKGPGLRFPRQAQLHPMRYLDGLLFAVQARGGEVFGGARATQVSGVDPLCVEIADRPSIRANAVVVATNTPFNYTVATHTKQAAYRSYVVAFRAGQSRLPLALWWDIEDPFHYVRLHREGDQDVVIVGGEDHKTGQSDLAPAEPYERLEAWAHRNIPGLGAVIDRWSGQVNETTDGLAFIGRVERGREVFVATGDCGNGMTHGSIAGMLLCDLILGRPSAWVDVYDPARLRLRSFARFAQENANVAVQYTDWLSRKAGVPVEDIPIETGTVVRRGLTPLAVYRDAEGALHECSAVCPHLGCIVAWNASERTWDCPCHGSRFAPTGEVIHGPATQGLHNGATKAGRANGNGGRARTDSSEQSNDQAIGDGRLANRSE